MLVIDFEVGRVRPLRGWITKAVIAISESAADGITTATTGTSCEWGPANLLGDRVLRWINAES